MKNFLGHFFYYQKSKFNEKWFKLNYIPKLITKKTIKIKIKIKINYCEKAACLFSVMQIKT